MSTPINPSWEYVNLGQDIYLVYPTEPITCSGAAVTTNFNFAFPFKLLAIWLEHTSSVGALSVDALTWGFYIAPRLELLINFPIVSYNGSTESQFLEIFGDDYVFPAGNYRFIQNSTNTDRIRVSFIIQKRTLAKYEKVEVVARTAWAAAGAGDGAGGGVGEGALVG